MTVEVLPLGTRCSLACEMCYQAPIRSGGNQAGADYDMDAMRAALEREGQPFTTFGGEPLLVPVEDLAELWRWGHEKYGRNSIQTSATCVTERHYELFRDYNVHVGVSLEGPGELNDIRSAGTLERTREATRAAEAVVHRLLESGHGVSLITTLNRGNASAERLPRLMEWFGELDSKGLRHVNIHLMEVDDPTIRGKWTLTPGENAAALIGLSQLQRALDGVRFQPITDMVALLLGRDGQTSCIWNACDPGTTRAVRGVNGQGESTNCSRTNKAGVDQQKADRESLVRPIALYHTPQSAAGCQGCRFWFACKGSCPGEAVNGDWRNRTEHCESLLAVFGYLERQLAALGFRPISRDPATRQRVEAAMLEAFARDQPIRVQDALQRSSSPAPTTKKATPRGGDNAPHGDTPHGDHNDTAQPVVTHGDHTDAGGKA